MWNWGCNEGTRAVGELIDLSGEMQGPWGEEKKNALYKLGLERPRPLFLVSCGSAVGKVKDVQLGLLFACLPALFCMW